MAQEAVIMSIEVMPSLQVVPQFIGLRLSAEEFFALPDDGCRYELVNGVVIVTPSPLPRHQKVALEIARQLANYLEKNPVGDVFPETDVHLGQGAAGGDLVYRPEMVYFRAERLGSLDERLVGAPDLVVEVVSPPTRYKDIRTKRDDYERLGVREYWMVDPDRDSITFLRHDGTKFVEVQPEKDRFASHAVEGFELNIADVRATFKGK
jgi:Uma2 family endonuclease